MKSRLILLLLATLAVWAGTGCTSRGPDGLPVAQPAPVALAVVGQLSPLKSRWSEGNRTRDIAALSRTFEQARALPATSPAREPAMIWAEAARSTYVADSSDPWVDVAFAHADGLITGRTPLVGDAATVLLAWADHVRVISGFRAAQSLYLRCETRWDGIEADPGTPPVRPPDAHPAGTPERLRVLQDRLARLYDHALLPQQTFAFAQAQSALDVALDEQHQHGSATLVAAWADRGEAVVRVLESAPLDRNALAATLAAPLPGPPATTQSLRADLLALAQGARPADLADMALVYAPVAATAARLEVTLAQARREYAERGYRAARPYLQAAEHLAKTLTENSVPTPNSVP